MFGKKPVQHTPITPSEMVNQSREMFHHVVTIRIDELHAAGHAKRIELEELGEHLYDLEEQLSNLRSKRHSVSAEIVEIDTAVRVLSNQLKEV